MAHLVISKEGEVLRRVPVLGNKLTIGRKSSNDIQIDNPLVSNEHAVIVSAEKYSYVADLGSTNGTRVNGNAIAKHLLNDNDVIAIGDCHICYIAEKESGGKESESQKTIIMPAFKGAPAAPETPASLALPPWRQPKNQIAFALATLAVSIWGEKIYHAYSAKEAAISTPAAAVNPNIIECKKLYSRVESETGSAEKAHDAAFSAYKQGACKG